MRKGIGFILACGFLALALGIGQALAQAASCRANCPAGATCQLQCRGSVAAPAGAASVASSSPVNVGNRGAWRRGPGPRWTGASGSRMGRGYGRGQGYRWGRGNGPGRGRGAAFVDRDGNGICDRFGSR